MADVTFVCPKCKQTLEAPEEVLGQTVQCPACSATIAVPVRRATATPAPQPPRMKQCPYCSEDILATAKKCKHCGETVDVALRTAEEARRGQGVQMVNINARQAEQPTDDGDSQSSGLVTAGWLTAFLMPFVGLILGIVLLVKGRRIGHAIGILVVSVAMFAFWAEFWPAFFTAAGE